jgi:hypothetical protein
VRDLPPRSYSAYGFIGQGKSRQERKNIHNSHHVTVDETAFPACSRPHRSEHNVSGGSPSPAHSCCAKARLHRSQNDQKTES